MKGRLPLRSLQRPPRNPIRTHVRSPETYERWRRHRVPRRPPLPRDERMSTTANKNRPNRKFLSSLKHQSEKGRPTPLWNSVASHHWTHLLINSWWLSKICSDPDSRPKNLYYRFHRDHGHLIENYMELKEQVETLIRQGKLQKYVSRSSNTHPSKALGL